jgi:hypothetical protein
VDRRWWWLPLRLLGTVLEAAAVVGLLWLTVLAVLDYLRLPAPEPPAIGSLAWPTLLLLAGTAGLVIFALVRRRLVRGGAAGHARRIARRLRAAVEKVAVQRVIEPLQEEVAAHDQLAKAVAALRR